VSLLVSGNRPTEITQGVTGETVLIVNQSSDVILVGDRDTLQTLGLSLQPLASIAVKDTKSWWAQSQNSAGSSLDFLYLAEGWSPSPAQIAQQITTSTLANAIAAAILQTGSRLVDNGLPANPFALSGTSFLAGNVYGLNSTMNGFVLNPTNPVAIDVSNYTSMVLTANSNAPAVVTVYHLDQLGSILFWRTYEVMPNIDLNLSDNLYGASLAVSFWNQSASNAGLTGSIRLSNRSLPGELLDCGPGNGAGFPNAPDSSDFLLTATGTVAGGANSPTFTLPPLTGKYSFTLGIGFLGSTLRYFYGSTNGGSQRIYAAWSTVVNAQFEVPAIRRPLYFFIANTSGASSTFGVMVTRSRAD